VSSKGCQAEFEFGFVTVAKFLDFEIDNGAVFRYFNDLYDTQIKSQILIPKTYGR
jgi:hypothetical protein